MLTLPSTTTRLDTTTTERLDTDVVLRALTPGAAPVPEETPAPVENVISQEAPNNVEETYEGLVPILDSSPAVHVTGEDAVHRLGEIMNMVVSLEQATTVEATSTPTLETATTTTTPAPITVAETVEVQTPENTIRSLTLTDLPSEILRLVLYDAAVDAPADRRRLLGICFLWRDILTNMSHLWTSLRIVSYHENAETFTRFLWRLDLQIQRCGPLMLDVHWHTAMSRDQTAELFALLSKKAPFSRWKSLVINYCENGPMEDDMLTEMSDFRNLSSIKLYSCAPDRLLRRVNDSVTSKLTHVEFYSSGMGIGQWNSEMGSVLKHLTTIQLPNFDVDSTVLLPENVKEITTYYIPDCAFPHVTKITTTGWNPLRRFKNRHFPNLEYLSTNFTRLDASMDTHATLASLTTLIVSGCEFEALALMTLPNLHVLRISARDMGDQVSYKREIETLRAAVTRREMSLHPTGVLEIDVPLPVDVMVKAIKRLGSKTREMVLRARGSYDGWETLRALFISPPDTSFAPSPTTLKETAVLPRVQTLGIRTRVVKNEANEKLWRAFMTRILEERRDTSLETVNTVWSCAQTTTVTRTEVLG